MSELSPDGYNKKLELNRTRKSRLVSELSSDERYKKRKKGLKEATPTKAYNKKLELNRKEGQTQERHAQHLKSNQKQLDIDLITSAFGYE